MKAKVDVFFSEHSVEIKASPVKQCNTGRMCIQKLFCYTVQLVS